MNDDTKAQGAERRGAGSAKSHHAGSAELGGEAKVGASWRDSGKPWENYGQTMGKPWENHGKTMGQWGFNQEKFREFMGFRVDL